LMSGVFASGTRTKAIPDRRPACSSTARLPGRGSKFVGPDNPSLPDWEARHRKSRARM
jgi:hypothetical protein